MSKLLAVLVMMLSINVYADTSSLDAMVQETIKAKLAQFPAGSMIVDKQSLYDQETGKSTEYFVIRCKSVTQAKGCL